MYNLTSTSALGTLQVINYINNANLQMVYFNTANSYMISSDSITSTGFACIIYTMNNSTGSSMLFDINGPNNDLSFRSTMSYITPNAQDINVAGK